MVSYPNNDRVVRILPRSALAFASSRSANASPGGSAAARREKHPRSYIRYDGPVPFVPELNRKDTIDFADLSDRRQARVRQQLFQGIRLDRFDQVMTEAHSRGPLAVGLLAPAG